MIPAKNKSPAYNLVPDSVQIPKLGDTADDRDPIAVLKWFTPDGGWTWYVVEYDFELRIGYGLVRGLETECGTFSLDEIEQIRGALGLPVERDLYWKPRPLSECRRSP